MTRPELPSRPARTAALRSGGWTASAQRHAVQSGRAERPRRTVLAGPQPVADEHEAARAALLLAARASAATCPRAAISHFAAAVAHGMPTYGRLVRPCLTVPPGTALRDLARAHLHRATTTDEDVSDVDGDRVLVPARTVMDVAREHGVDAGVVAADYALHEGLTDDAGLRAAFDQCAGWPGRRRAGRTLLRAEALTESVLESLSRLRILDAGLPAPRPQARLCDRFGRFLGRVDFYWDAFGVVGEADGAAKYRAGAAVVEDEKDRHGDLEDAGLVVVRWGWRDLSDPGRLAHRLTLAFARGARPGAPDRRWGVLPALHPAKPLT